MSVSKFRNNIKGKLSVKGVYLIPEEWRATDEANPNLFTYSVRCSGFHIEKGKV